MPRMTIVEIPPAEQARMLTELRQARYGYLLALHLLLLCAAGRSPTEIAAVLFCSRSSVYRVVKAYRAGQWEGAIANEGVESGRARRAVLGPALKRSVLAILQAVPRLWVVSHPVELCDDCAGVAGSAGACGVGRDGAPVAA